MSTKTRNPAPFIRVETRFSGPARAIQDDAILLLGEAAKGLEDVAAGRTRNARQFLRKRKIKPC